MPGELDQAYVLARRVLLDALKALAEHREAVILVGAQAIYLHTGEGDLATGLYTSDGDLALDPSRLGPIPILEHALGGAGFRHTPASGAIGTWIGHSGVQIDLMVPAGVAPTGSGRRSASLSPHGNRTARTARGLEAALLDYQEVLLSALDPGDNRQIRVKVAGPTALLVAKLHKLADRRQNPRRQDDKDALDVYRLLQAVPTDVLANGVRILFDETLSAAITHEAVTYLRELFGYEGAEGCQMAARAVELLDDPETVAASCAALTQDLLHALQSP
jgi:predicted nucleotidyltransferase